MNNVFIIAEAGVNHNGNPDIAKRLIDVAVDAGANAVKFQTFQADKLVIPNADKANYQLDNTNKNETQYDMLKKLELAEDAYSKLFKYSSKKNIIFISTPFDEESLDIICDIGVPIIKVPSGEITNQPFLYRIAQKQKPIIISTGMSGLGEIENAIHWINWNQNSLNFDSFPLENHINLLHCVSNYPAAFQDINLNAIQTMKRAFGVPVGFSDHSLGIEVSIAAVAIGASIIEKHFTLDKTLEGPDHRASLEPHELKHMISGIRHIEVAMGDGIKKPVQSENNTRQVARKSLVAAKDISKGRILTSDDLIAKRPGTGLSPEFKDIIIGLQAKNHITKNTLLKWEDFKGA